MTTNRAHRAAFFLLWIDSSVGLNIRWEQCRSCRWKCSVDYIKAVTIGWIVNRQRWLPTHCIYSSEIQPKWRNYFISTIHIFHLSCRLSFPPCYILSLSILFYWVWGNERGREEDQVACLLLRFTAIWLSGPLWGRWPSPWAVHIQANMTLLI